MCGVFGYIGNKNCIQDIYNGLSVLEYRGYDSAGIAVYHDAKIHTVKSEGKLAMLQPLLKNLPSSAQLGMGHTRWATHGAPTTINAHPHVSEGIALIHNGIVENYDQLKKNLIAEGYSFDSATDTEVALKLVISILKKKKCSMFHAVLELVKQIRGSFAIAIISAHEPDGIYILKKGSPVAIGVGNGENFFASDALSLVKHTKKALFLQDGEIAFLTPQKVDLFDFHGQEILRTPTQLQWSETSIEKKGFKHFMLKEIYDQPGMVASTIKRLVDISKKSLNYSLLGIDGIDIKKVESIHMVACGTAFYAASVSRYFLEAMLGIPVSVELAHEYRYRKALVNEKTLLISVSQSGETADTLASVHFAKEHGAQTFAICNVQHSSIARDSHGRLYMEAGPEIGVASTKAFTSMILNLYLLGHGLAHYKNPKSFTFSPSVFDEMMALPVKIEQALDSFDYVDRLAYHYSKMKSCLFIGRGMSFALALEGALKLKEISYIHAEGFAGGELKHGPIALVDANMAVIAIAPQDEYYEKMLSNVEEVVARHGKVIGIGVLDDSRFHKLSSDYLATPGSNVNAFSAIINAVPLQLFAYCAAVHRGTDVDQPRNLAKSVTVE